MPRKLRLARRIVSLSLVVPMIWTVGASASLRSCSYRNMTHGEIPYVAQARTDLTAAALGGADVCAVVSEVVTQVQRRGFDLGAAPALLDCGRSWILEHRLIYPRGWPRPAGPVFDPHMHVTLRMLARGPALQAQRAPVGAPRMRSYWIELNEYS